MNYYELRFLSAIPVVTLFVQENPHNPHRQCSIQEANGTGKSNQLL